MKFNIVKQPIGIAILSHLAIVVLSLLFAAEPTALSTVDLTGLELAIAPLGQHIAAYGAAHPTWGAWLAGILLFVTATILTRTNYRYSLYGTNSSITFPIFAMVMSGVLYGGDYLSSSLVAMLSALMLQHILGGYRNGFGFDQLFRGAACMGLLLLIEPATAPLVLLLAATAVTLRRTTREMVVMVGGLLLPIATLLYLNWAMGGDFSAPVVALYREATAGEWFGLFDHAPLSDAIFFMVVMVATAIGVLLFLANSYALSNKARHIMIFVSRMWLLSLVVVAMPSASVGLLATVAIPCSLLIPVLLIRTHRSVAQLIYLLFTAASIALILLR